MSSVEEFGSSMGVVREVRTEVQGIYYNVTVSVSRRSRHVVKWYKTPGQYVDLLPVKSQHKDSVSFFIASPLFGRVQDDDLFLEFLIADVPGTVAGELIRSQPGDSVVVTINDDSKGFDIGKLYPISSAESVLMFASGYGLGPMRAFIETDFLAKHRKDAILYTLYPRNQEPYMEKHPTWET